MADDYQSGICSGSWWNSVRSGGFNGTAASSAATDGRSRGGVFSWSDHHTAEMVDHEPAVSASGSSITNQDSHNLVAGQFIDSTFSLSSPTTMDWNQSLLSGRSESSNFHAMLQDGLSSRPGFLRQDSSVDSNDQVHPNLFKDMNQSYLLDQHDDDHLSSGNEPGHIIYESLFGSADNPATTSVVNYSQSPTTGYCNTPSWPRLPLNDSSAPKQQHSTNQFHFSNNTPFWNASSGEAKSGFYPPMPVSESNSEGARDLGCSTTKKSSSGGEPKFKKTRMGTPSPLPTFKVRKEKLGDRITALQQLVSPFGKTDTASVLHEAIDYIKFLHDQVSVLSTPYLKNGQSLQHQQNLSMSENGEGPNQDLRSRGLCLVPVAGTYPVASEIPADFWTPTFGGTYR